MNPKIATDYDEVGRWLRNFAISHAKREHPRTEAIVELDAAREGRSYGLRLVLGPAMEPPAGAAPIEIAYADVAEGRARFAWCEALAQRIRTIARGLATQTRTDATRSA